MKRRKLITLIFSILITIGITILFCAYDFNVWYNPNEDGKNCEQLQSDYKAYLLSNAIDYASLTETEKTEARIDLYRKMYNEYYAVDPVYKKDVVVNNTRLFTIVIYQNLITQLKSATEIIRDNYRYEVFVYNVDYVALKNLYGNMALPTTSQVENSDDPVLMLNFYQDDTFKESEALIVNDTYKTTVLPNEDQICGYNLARVKNFNIYDYNSTPQLNKDNTIYHCGSMIFYSYSASNIYGGDLSKFEEIYVKVDCVIGCKDNSNTNYYVYKDSLLEDKVEGMTFDTSTIDHSSPLYEKGFNSIDTTRKTFNLIKIKGVKTYDQWVVSKYVWWQTLICFVFTAAVMTGFYFAFSGTLDNVGKNKIKKDKKK